MNISRIGIVTQAIHRGAIHRGVIALALAVFGSQAVRADLTIRYEFELKFSPAFPPAVVDMVKAQMGNLLGGERTTLVKGGKCTSRFGSLTTIIDAGTSQMTLFDPAGKRFATVALSDYMDLMAHQNLPATGQAAVQNLLQSMKIDVQTKQTGETATIQGIQAEDKLVTVSIEMPTPAAVPVTLRLEIHQWWPTAAELARIPALGEIAGCAAGLSGSDDPSAVIQKILSQLPGAAEKLGEAMKEIVKTKGAPVLRTEVKLYAPALAAIAQLQGGQGVAVGADLNAALVDLGFNLVELSTRSLSDTAFQIPAGYQQAPLEEVLKALPLPGVAQAQPKSPAAVAAGAPIDDFTGPVARPGNGVTNPAVVSQVTPQYDEQARVNKIEGSVLLLLVVDESGAARNIKVVRSLDPGLDQKAIEAVRKWKFKPGQKDGNPVAVQAQIQVTFKLLDKPPGN
jgi:TonB family protein